MKLDNVVGWGEGDWGGERCEVGGVCTGGKGTLIMSKILK